MKKGTKFLSTVSLPSPVSFWLLHLMHKKHGKFYPLSSSCLSKFSQNFRTCTVKTLLSERKRSPDHPQAESSVAVPLAPAANAQHQPNFCLHLGAGGTELRAPCAYQLRLQKKPLKQDFFFFFLIPIWYISFAAQVSSRNIHVTETPRNSSHREDFNLSKIFHLMNPPKISEYSLRYKLTVSGYSE